MVKRNKRRTSKVQAQFNLDAGAAAAGMPEQAESNLHSGSPSPTRPKSARVQARRDTNPERAQAIQRLKDAISAGDFDTDMENAGSEGEGKDDQGPKTRTRGTNERQATRRRSLRGRQAREDHDGDDELETTSVDVNEKLLKVSEHGLLLKLSTEGLGAGRANNLALQLEDMDWSEFDSETINAILDRREELRKRRRRDAGEAVGGGETAPAKQKELSPALPQPTTASQAAMPTNEGEVTEEGGFASLDTGAMATIAEVDEPTVDENQITFAEYDEEEGDSSFFTPVGLGRTIGDGMDVDAEGDQAQLNYLFSEAAEEPSQTPGASLLLPPRHMASRYDIGENAGTNSASEVPPAALHALRPQMTMLRGSADVQPGGIADMRLVLQMELKREEDLLKGLRAEIVDKISKLATEEKLLRMVVKHDFELGGDDLDEDTNTTEAAFGGFGEIDSVLAPVQSGALDLVNDMGHGDDSDGDSDSGDSISGMSSSTSEDEVQDEEIARGALNRMLDQYLPSS
ncbi:hypothetical protein GGI20_002416 [Coemansia sp. BCRC 34301]|nr:hypothetical protein GGI20_002416 [Coemansia sp. BCRC 34301]